MAANTKNKYPADKSGTRYADFKNTKRLSTSKATRTGTTGSGGPNNVPKLDTQNSQGQ